MHLHPDKTAATRLAEGNSSCFEARLAENSRVRRAG